MILLFLGESQLSGWQAVKIRSIHDGEPYPCVGFLALVVE
jgi:hypothetical protein